MKQLANLIIEMGQMEDLSSVTLRDSCKYSKVLADLKYMEMRGALNRNCLIRKIRYTHANQNAHMTYHDIRSTPCNWGFSKHQTFASRVSLTIQKTCFVTIPDPGKLFFARLPILCAQKAVWKHMGIVCSYINSTICSPWKKTGG